MAHLCHQQGYRLQRYGITLEPPSQNFEPEDPATGIQGRGIIVRT